MIDKIELRNSTLSANEDNKLVVSGIVNKTGTWSNILGKRKKFRERVNKGVFKKAIEEAKRIDFLAEHDRNQLLSSTENDSLKLWEDEDGLKMEASIAPTSYGKDTYALIKSNLKNYMSFGFKVLKDSWDIGSDGIYERTINEIALQEVSTVRNSAYAASIIEARGIEVIKDIEIKNINKKGDINKMSKIEKVKFMDTNVEKTLKSGKKVSDGYTLEETLLARVNNSEVLSLCKNSIADSNTGVSIFPLINDYDISYMEVKAEGIECSKQASDIVVNSDENFVDKVKIILENDINTKIEEKLCLELNKVKALTVDKNDCEKVEQLFVQFDNKYLGENFIICNSEDYKKLLCLKNAVGDGIVAFDKGNNLVKLNTTSTGTVRAYINHTPILVNDTMECIALFTPEYVGISHLKLHEFEEVITTALRRSGKREWMCLTGAGVKILDSKSVVTIKL